MRAMVTIVTALMCIAMFCRAKAEPQLSFNAIFSESTPTSTEIH